MLYKYHPAILLVMFFTFGSYTFASIFSEYIFNLIIFILNSTVIFTAIFTKKVSLSKNIFYPLTFILAVVSLVITGWIFNNSANGFGYILMLSNMATIMISVYICTELESDKVSLYNLVIIITIIFLIFELITRIFFYEYIGLLSGTNRYKIIENMIAMDDGGFYRYKMTSYLRFDSNGVGAIAFLAAVFSFMAAKLNYPKAKLYSGICFVLVLLTFSRAAIAMSLLALILIFVQDKKTLKILVLIFIPIIVIPPIMLMLADGSGQSKLQIIESLSEYITNQDVINLTIGNGLAADIFDQKITSVEGVFGHNYFVFLLFHLGFVGMIFYFLTIVSFIAKRKKERMVFFFLLIIGLSYLRPFEVFIFFALAITNIFNDEQFTNTR